jgi:hypothetical protein
MFLVQVTRGIDGWFPSGHLSCAFWTDLELCSALHRNLEDAHPKEMYTIVGMPEVLEGEPGHV